MVSDRVYDRDVTVVSISWCCGDKCWRGQMMVSNDASFEQKGYQFFFFVCFYFVFPAVVKQSRGK